MTFANLDEKNDKPQAEYKKNPWLRFTGADGKYDKLHAPHRFRSLDSYRQLMTQVALTHWDNDIKRKVACGRRIWKDKEGNFKLTKVDNCWYCTQDKQHKVDFEKLKSDNDPSVANQKFARRPMQLDVCVVARVAVLNKDKSQSFALAALPAKDLVFGTGKGVYKTLTEFEEAARSDEENPSDLRDYWWDFGPKSFSNVPGKNGMVTDKQKEVVPEGIVDEDGVEFDINDAQPFDYNEAMQMRSELKNVDARTRPYGAQVKEVEKNIEIDHGDVDKNSGTGNFEDDDIPPF